MVSYKVTNLIFKWTASFYMYRLDENCKNERMTIVLLFAVYCERPFRKLSSVEALWDFFNIIHCDLDEDRLLTSNECFYPQEFILHHSMKVKNESKLNNFVIAEKLNYVSI